MGLGSSNLLIVEQPAPDKLSEFKKLAIAPETYSIPEIPQKRQPTDVVYLIVFGVNISILFAFLIYTFCNVHGLNYDNCGNVCGEKNDYVDGVECSGKNMIDSEYLEIDKMIDIESWKDESFRDNVPRHCAASCTAEEHLIIGKVCFPLTDEDNATLDVLYIDLSDLDGSLVTTGKQLTHRFGTVLVMVTLSMGLCLGMLMLFRYATAPLIWGIIAGCYAFLIFVTLVLWFTGKGYTAPLVMTAVAIGVTGLLAVTFKRIPMVINLFREAVKAIFAMPVIIFEPILTFWALFITISSFMLTIVYASRAGTLTKVDDEDDDNNNYTYEPNVAISFGVFMNVVVTVWMIKFIIGCQVMVISGAISSWYFARDKTFLGTPIKDSFVNLVKFHLGSVAFGSMIMTVVGMIKFILKTLSKNRRTRFLVAMCLGILQSTLAYIGKNAYIQVAMHGEGFFTSGKRAVRLLHANLQGVLAVNSIGDFVLFMAKLFIVILTIFFGVMIVGRDSFEDDVIISLAALNAAIMAHALFSIFETAIDTIFLCYCEDCSINDGIERPYYMSVDLMQFFDQSKAELLAAKV